MSRKPMQKIKNLRLLEQKAKQMPVTEIRVVADNTYRVHVSGEAQDSPRMWTVYVKFLDTESLMARCNCTYWTQRHGNVVGCSHILAALHALGAQKHRQVEVFGTRREAEASRPEKVLRLVGYVTPQEDESITLYVATRAA